MHLGRRFGAALSVFALGLLAPAAAPAQTVQVQVKAADRSGNQIPDEEPLAVASVRLPPGRVSVSDPLAVLWAGRRPPRTSLECLPRVGTYAVATAKPMPFPERDLQRRTVHRTRTSVVLTGAGLPAPLRVRAERVVGRGKVIRVLFGVVHVRLPNAVLPLLARREIYLTAFDMTGLELSGTCPASERRAESAVRSVIAGVRIAVPPSYVPPPGPDTPPTLDLAGGEGLQMPGVLAGEEAGSDVAAAGDVNGDGLADAIVSADFGNGGTSASTGAAWVVFGGPGPRPLARLGPSGFRIDGPSPGQYHFAAAGVGDLDGDGLAELAVGAPHGGRDGNGVVYIVRGKRDGATVDLARRDDVLFAIYGGHHCAPGLGGDNIGQQVAAAGDANGDGLGDIAVLVPDNCGDYRVTGALVVVFGKRTSGDIDLRRLGAAGITVPAESDAEFSDVTIAGVGDTDGDGLADVVIGGAGFDEPSYAVVVPGRRTGGTVRLSHLAMKVTSKFCWDVGGAAAGPGDVNGDGFADVAVGAPEGCGDFGPRAFVVFGGPSPRRVNLDSLGTRGFEIVSTARFVAGRELGAAGDVNGDGLADLALGDPDYGQDSAGAVVLVYGRRSTELVRLRSLGGHGFRWLGLPGSKLGDSLAGIGDFDGDGRPDLLAGTPGRDSSAGGAWVLPSPR